MLDDPGNDPSAQAAVEELARLTGARVVRASADEHDHAVAAVSHVPQVIASALAGSLVGRGELPRLLAGPAVREMTRIAASRPELWLEILRLNARPVADTLRELVTQLSAVADDLADSVAGSGGDHSSLPAVESLLRQGNAGRALLF